MKAEDLTHDPSSLADDHAIAGELVGAELVGAQLEGTTDAAVIARPAEHVIETVDRAKRSSQRSVLFYLGLPAIFLTVALLGGLRLGLENVFVFLKPSLFCLIGATILLILFFRARLIVLDAWFSEDFSAAKNVANGAILLTLFAAATQLFNSLLPERGLPFWIVGFCFFWTLWNNLFADFDTKRLLRSLGALFGLAFVVKYILLAYISEPTGKNWVVSVLENPMQEATVALLDLPRFSAGTGYLQFFAVVLFLLGLFLLPARTDAKERS